MGFRDDGASKISGGYLKEIPTPHVRRWPSVVLRPVFVHIAVYDVVGGKHYYPDIKEQDNPIWNAKRECWQIAWDDEQARGRAFIHPGFNRLIDAHEWVASILAEHFPPTTHKVLRTGGMRAFYYRRTGD